MPAGQAGGQFDLDEGRRGGFHRARAHGAPLRRRGRRHGLRRKGPGRHLRAQDRDLPARLRHSGRTGRLPARGHHLRSQHLRRRHRHGGAQQLRRRLHRGGALDPRTTCRTRMCPAASPTCHLRSAATSACARPCIRCSSITRSTPAWTMGIVNAGQIAVYDTLDPELREACEDVVLNRRADAAERLLEARRQVPRQRARRRGKSISPGASDRWRSGSRTRWCRASPTSSRPTSRRRGSRPSARSTSSKAR